MNDHHDRNDHDGADADIVISRLTDLGAETGPPVDPRFADGLESNLRVMAAERDHTQASSPLWRRPALALLATVVLVAIGWGALQATTGDPAGLIVTAASNTEVSVPNEATWVEATPGLRLPDGTRIEVGGDGEATVGGVVLSPGSVAIVADGRLEILGPVLTATTLAGSDSGPPAPAGRDPQATDATGPAAAPDSTDSRSTVSSSVPERPTTSASDRTSPTSSATTPSSTTGAPDPTRPAPSTTSTSGATSSTSVTTPVTPPTTAGPLLVTLDLQPLSGARVRLDWTLDGSGPVAGWEIRARRGDRSTTLAVLRDVSARSATVEQLRGDNIAYEIVAVDAGGAQVATSGPVIAPAS